MKNSMDLQKIKNINKIAMWSSNYTNGNISKGNKTTNLKRYLHHSVHGSIINNSQDTETICISQDDPINKLWHTYMTE